MAIICPSVTAKDHKTYKHQLDKLAPFASRVHIDIGDGVFAPKLVPIKDINWPTNLIADIHVMYKDPSKVIDQLIELKPNLVILHAEADGKFYELAKLLHDQ